MKTAAVTRLGDLRSTDPETRGLVEVIDLPAQELGPEDVRIRVAYAGICGSDPHVADGMFGSAVPIGLGHEISGIVEELGPRATRNGLKIGDRVAGNFLRFCGTCAACRDGRQQFCSFAQEYNRPGMSETLVWHESQVYQLPDGVSLRKGALLEPLAVAVRIVDKTRVRVGDRVLVSGGGPIGQFVLQLMARYGATSLTMSEPIADRRAMALRGGAQHVIDPVSEDLGARVAELTDGRGYDIVIDASGSPRATESLLSVAARGGTVIYGATYPVGYKLPLDLTENLFMRELTITGAYVAPYAFPRALQLLPLLDLDDFTQVVYSLDDAQEAFAVHMSGRHPKILIQPNDLGE